jgi:PHP family Zn ribbon phosphoesterase
MIRNTPDKPVFPNHPVTAQKSSITNVPDTQDQRDDAKLSRVDKRIKKNCGKCNFRYMYDPLKDYPQNCPNCGGEGRSHLVTTPLRR